MAIFAARDLGSVAILQCPSDWWTRPGFLETTVRNHIIIESDSMKKTSITVTEAARNFADCVNRAHYQNVTFVLLKNGEPFARLVPDNEKVCVGRDLAEVLATAKLNESEARAWHRDLRAARKVLKAPANSWR